MRRIAVPASLFVALVLMASPASSQSSHLTTGFAPNTPNAEVAPPPTWMSSPMLFWPYQSVPVEGQGKPKVSQRDEAKPGELGGPSAPLPAGPNAIARDRIESPHDNQSPQH
jgi:hypothetical protein